MKKSEVSALKTHRQTLELEAALAADTLGHGLTSLRNYSFADKGRFFSGMFMLSIGLERVAKLGYLLSELQENGHFPHGDILKKNLGHDLGKLVEQARSINQTKSLGVDTSKVDEPLCAEITKLLSSFAKYSRYHNLNLLSGIGKSGDEEPLAAWDRVIGQEIVRRHHRVTKREREELAYASSLAGIPGIVVAHELEDGSENRDIEALAQASLYIETKQKYSTYYTLCIVEFCVNVLEALDRRSNLQVCISEYFRIFNTLDRRAVLRRKRWNRLG